MISSLTFILINILYTLKARSTNITFLFTGASQNYTVPEDISVILFEAYGAQGGTVQGSGGLGGFTSTTIAVLPGAVLQVLVGGSGGLSGGGGASGCFNPYGAPMGGGSTDLRLSPYGIESRIVVAGGTA